MAVEVTDEMVQRLAKTWVAAIPLQYPEPKHPHHFSLRFHLKMMPLLREAQKKERGSSSYRGRQLAIAFLAAALMTVTIAMAVPAIREKVFQMVRDVYEKYSHIHYEQVGPAAAEETPSPEEFTPYHLTYIPEGFFLVEERTTDISHKERFENENNLCVVFNQSRVEKAEFSVDTENEKPEELTLLNGKMAWYLGNQSLKVIYWENNEYFFLVSGPFPREEMVKIANSIENE